MVGRARALALTGLALAAGTLAGAPGRAGAQTFELLDYSGGELYRRFCAACHGAGGRGDGPVGARLNVAVPDLTRISARRGGRFPAGEIAETVDGRSLVVAHGTREMPVWGYEFWVEEGGDVTAEADAREIIDRLVDYLRSIQVEPADPAQPR